MEVLGLTAFQANPPLPERRAGPLVPLEGEGMGDRTPSQRRSPPRARFFAMAGFEPKVWGHLFDLEPTCEESSNEHGYLRCKYEHPANKQDRARLPRPHALVPPETKPSKNGKKATHRQCKHKDDEAKPLGHPQENAAPEREGEKDSDDTHGAGSRLRIISPWSVAVRTTRY